MGKKILIVDDNLSIVQMVSMIFRRRNYVVFEAKNGVEGISIAKKEKPDLIILDVGLPDMTGYEVCKVIKENKKTTNARILMLTGKTLVKDVEQGFQVDADAYLLKPFVAERLVSKVEELL